MIEIESTGAIGDLVATRIHPAGRRACTYEKSQLGGVSQLHNYVIQGYDMVSANAAANVLQARLNVNQSRGVTPP